MVVVAFCVVVVGVVFSVVLFVVVVFVVVVFSVVVVFVVVDLAVELVGVICLVVASIDDDDNVVFVSLASFSQRSAPTSRPEL